MQVAHDDHKSLLSADHRAQSWWKERVGPLLKNGPTQLFMSRPIYIQAESKARETETAMVEAPRRRRSFCFPT